MAGKGKPKTGGRKKGTPNKTTQAIKAALLGALETAQGDMHPDLVGKKLTPKQEAAARMGAEPYFRRMAHADRPLFVSLLRTVLPSELKIESDDGLPLVITKDYTRSKGAK